MLLYLPVTLRLSDRGINSVMVEGWVWESPQLLVRQGKEMRGLIRNLSLKELQYLW